MNNVRIKELINRPNMCRLLSKAESETLFALTVFKTCFSEDILLLSARTGFDDRVSLYNSWVSSLYTALVTLFADSLRHPERGTLYYLAVFSDVTVSILSVKKIRIATLGSYRVHFWFEADELRNSFPVNSYLSFRTLHSSSYAK